MGTEVKVHGIVLSSMPVGEYDRRVTILTQEIGRIAAFVKGARRPKSAFSACSQSFTYAEFVLYEGRDSYNLSSFSNPVYFEELRTSLDAMYMGLYFCELLGYLTRENNDESDQFKLLYVALLALKKGELPLPLIRSVFELKAIAIYGEALVAEGPFYSRRGNGLTKEEYAGSKRVDPSTLYAVQYLLAAKPSKLFSFTVSDKVLGELVYISNDYMKSHIDRPMKTLEVFNN